MTLVVGIGTGLEEVHRFNKFHEKSFEVFLKKNFTPKELEYCLSKEAPAPHLAARFAGKEAVIKDFNSLNILNIFYPAIEIVNDAHGAPFVKINTDYNKKHQIIFSLSHSYDMALAFCLIIQET